MTANTDTMTERFERLLQEARGQEKRDLIRVMDSAPRGDHSTDADLPPSVGERNSAAVLTEDKVRAIRQAADAGADLATLARAFHVHVRTARHIVQRTSWRHVV